MVKVQRAVSNRVITVVAEGTLELDRYVSQLLDIIDSYGGSNPFPRFFVSDNFYFYSLTTKIPNDSLDAFDQDINLWRSKL